LKRTRLTFPEGKRFAFSIFDDTDVATVESIRPIYDLLTELGFRTTKTTWSLNYEGASEHAGTHTLQSERYSEYLRDLAERGFEIAFHGATMESTTRDGTISALEQFHRSVGAMPRSYASHAFNRDNLYWGIDRFRFATTRALYALLGQEKRGHYQGHVPESPYFWGDLATKYLDYVRSFTYATFDLTKLAFPVVYSRPDTPWVKRWFITCDADNVEQFNDLLASANQERLERDGGLCIVSTHLGKGFVKEGQVHPVTRRLLTELRTRNAWCVPVSPMLDYYCAQAGCREITSPQLLRMELRWFLDAVVRRRRRNAYEKTELPYLARSILESRESTRSGQPPRTNHPGD
jgi:hypothetical protein